MTEKLAYLLPQQWSSNHHFRFHGFQKLKNKFERVNLSGLNWRFLTSSSIITISSDETLFISYPAWVIHITCVMPPQLPFILEDRKARSIGKRASKKEPQASSQNKYDDGDDNNNYFSSKLLTPLAQSVSIKCYVNMNGIKKYNLKYVRLCVHTSTLPLAWWSWFSATYFPDIALAVPSQSQVTEPLNLPPHQSSHHTTTKNLMRVSPTFIATYPSWNNTNNIFWCPHQIHNVQNCVHNNICALNTNACCYRCCGMFLPSPLGYFFYCYASK